MSILNQDEIDVALEELFKTGSKPPSTRKLKEFLRDLVKSSKAYSVAMSGAADTFNITGTPTKFDNFTTNDATKAAGLMEVDAANDRIRVFYPGLYYVTLRFNGSWNTGEDLTFEVRVNGAPHFATPFSYQKEGKGALDPELLSVTLYTFPLFSAFFAGTGYADIEVYLSSSTGAFSLSQISTILGVRYEPFTINTI